MDNKLLHTKLIEELEKRVPEDTTVCHAVTEALNIKKESVYRRLRMEVPFQFAEIAVIARKFGISIDELIDNSMAGDSVSMQLVLGSSQDPRESDSMILQNLADMIRVLRTDPKSRACFSSSALPMFFYMRYPAVAHFYLFKWMYLYSNTQDTKKYNEIEPSESMKELQAYIAEGAAEIGETTYILDNMVFANLVKDINYFSSLNLIPKENVNILKDEINALIDDMESVASKGRYPSGNKVNFYISNVNFETSYTCCEAKDYHFSMIKAFVINGAASGDLKVFNMVNHWMQSLKRMSVLISECGEQQRILFFNEQRRIVNSLL